MKEKILFTTICFILLSCSNPSKSDEENNFAIYLLETDTLDYRDAVKIGLNIIDLEEKPMISSTDIACYDPSEENLYLVNSFEINGLVKRREILGPAGDVPFVLILKGERYFLGSHVGVACSHIFAGPRLDYYSDTTEGLSAFSISFSEEDKYLEEDSEYRSILIYFSK